MDCGLKQRDPRRRLTTSGSRTLPGSHRTIFRGASRKTQKDLDGVGGFSSSLYLARLITESPSEGILEQQLHFRRQQQDGQKPIPPCYMYPEENSNLATVVLQYLSKIAQKKGFLMIFIKMFSDWKHNQYVQNSRTGGSVIQADMSKSYPSQVNLHRWMNDCTFPPCMKHSDIYASTP